jgi:hypothetical protein
MTVTTVILILVVGWWFASRWLGPHKRRRP